MSKKKQKKSKNINRIPKEFNIPQPSSFIYDDKSDIMDDSGKLLVDFAKKYHYNASLKEQQHIIEKLVSLYCNQHKKYQKMLIDKEISFSLDTLMKKDRIDVTPLLALSSVNNDYAIPNFNTPFAIDALNAYPEKLDERFYASIPCFQEGVIQINKSRFIYFKIESLDLDNYYARIYINDYMLKKENEHESRFNMGRGVVFEIRRPTQKEITEHNMLVMIKNDIAKNKIDDDELLNENSPHTFINSITSFVDIYTKLSPKELGWNKDECKLWEYVTLQNAVNQETRFHNLNINIYEKLIGIFVTAIIISNYYLSKHKPVIVKNTTNNKSHEPNSAHKTSIKQNNNKSETLSEKKIRKVGVIKFISNKPPKQSNHNTLRHYTMAKWTARGHIRTYANGHTVYIKPQVRERKNLKQQNTSITQSVIVFNDNRKDDI